LAHFHQSVYDLKNK